MSLGETDDMRVLSLTDGMLRLVKILTDCVVIGIEDVGITIPALEKHHIWHDNRLLVIPLEDGWNPWCDHMEGKLVILEIYINTTTQEYHLGEMQLDTAGGGLYCDDADT